MLLIETSLGTGAEIRFGTSSFSSKDWIGSFYPEGCKPADFLRHYAARYDTVEVDSTYYAIPPLSTARRWVEKTPESFLFSLKFPRSIVHAGEHATPDSDRVLLPDLTYTDRDRFLALAAALGPRQGPLILQFPYFSKKVFSDRRIFFERLDRFLSDLPKDYRYGVEIRNRHWLTAEFAGLCRAHHVSLVLVDQAWMPAPWDLKDGLGDPTAEFAYIRLLGDRKEIEALTSSWSREVIDRAERLEMWAEYLVGNLEHHIPTLVYVNNHYAGHAPTTLNRLHEMFETRAGLKR